MQRNQIIRDEKFKNATPFVPFRVRTFRLGGLCFATGALPREHRP